MSLTREAVLSRLDDVMDPEMPLSIVQLGIVREVTVADGAVHIVAIPTFAGCPALDVIRDLIVAAVAELPDVDDVAVDWRADATWGPQEISEAGRDNLRVFGIAVDVHRSVTCPYCASDDVTRVSPYGPTLCRSMYHCLSCRNPFEAVKRLPMSPVPGVSGGADG